MTDQTHRLDEVYDQLRRALLEKLRQQTEAKSRSRFQDFSFGANDLLPGEAIAGRDREQVEALLCQLVHELYLERIIIPGMGSGPQSSHRMEWPCYRITDHGRRVLQSREYSPYDPDGYLCRLKSEIPGLDDTIVRYVEESLRCLRMDCLLAAAVTIGCASEKAMLILIERFGQAISNPAKKRDYDEKTKTWIISRKYKVLRASLESVAKDLPKQLHDALDQQLHGAFDLIRRIRNDAGHSTGDPVTREMIRASHIVFPVYCKYVYMLMNHFDTNRADL